MYGVGEVVIGVLYGSGEWERIIGYVSEASGTDNPRQKKIARRSKVER